MFQVLIQWTAISFICKYPGLNVNYTTKLQRKAIEKEGIHVKAVPRYLTWLKAHSREENGTMIFDNPIDQEIAEAIVSSRKHLVC